MAAAASHGDGKAEVAGERDGDEGAGSRPARRATAATARAPRGEGSAPRDRAGGRAARRAAAPEGGVGGRVLFVVCAIALVLLLILSWLPGVGGATMTMQRQLPEAAHRPRIARPAGASWDWASEKQAVEAQHGRKRRQGVRAGRDIYVTSHVVPTEYIVQFHEYLSPAAQEGVLNEALGQGICTAHERCKAACESPIRAPSRGGVCVHCSRVYGSCLGAWEMVLASRPFTGSATNSDFAAIKISAAQEGGGADEDRESGSGGSLGRRQAKLISKLAAQAQVKRVTPEKRLVLRSGDGGRGGGAGFTEGRAEEGIGSVSIDDDAATSTMLAAGGIDVGIAADDGAVRGAVGRERGAGAGLGPAPAFERGATGRRQLLSIPDKYNAKLLWAKGFKGAHVKVAVFDTGIAQNHKSFNHINGT